jgi:hypothetical protein
VIASPGPRGGEPMPGSGVAGGRVAGVDGVDVPGLAAPLEMAELCGGVGRACDRASGWRTAQAYPTVPTSADAVRTPIVHDRAVSPPNQDTSQSLNAGRVPAQHHHGGAPWHREELR